MLAGRRVFVRARAGAGTPVLLLHGFPTSSFDFHALWELLGDSVEGLGEGFGERVHMG